MILYNLYKNTIILQFLKTDHTAYPYDQIRNILLWVAAIGADISSQSFPMSLK